MDGTFSFVCTYINFIKNINKPVPVVNNGTYVSKNILCKVSDNQDTQVSSYSVEEDNIDNVPENIIDNACISKNHTANNEETESQESERTCFEMEKNEQKIILKINHGDATVENSSKNSSDEIIHSAENTNIKRVEEFSTNRNYNISLSTEQSVPVVSAEIKIVTSVNHDPIQDKIEKYRKWNQNIHLINNQDIIITKILDNKAITKNCDQCSLMKKCLYNVKEQDLNIFICSETCFISLQKFYQTNLKGSKITKFIYYTKKCVECSLEIKETGDKFLLWEFMDFCNVNCLSRYQCKFCSCCSHCRLPISIKSLGKYCVRFGHSIQQFCNMRCLVQFKKEWNVCAYCQNNLTKYDKLLSAHNLKRELKDFCSQLCLEKQIQINNIVNNVPTSEIFECSFCKEEKYITIYLNEANKNIKNTMFCSIGCFNSYKLVYLIFPMQCDLCKFYFDYEKCTQFAIYYNNGVQNFCCKNCQTMYILANRRVTSCCSCKVKKFDFEMINKSYNNDQNVMACSLRCLSLFEISSNAVAATEIKCDCCLKVFQTQLQLTVSDGTIRNFCNHECLLKFRSKCKKDSTHLVSLGDPKNIVNEHNYSQSENCNNSFEELQIPTKETYQIKLSNRKTSLTKSAKLKTRVKQVIIKIPPTPVKKIATASCVKETQTDQTNLYPVPVVFPITQNFTKNTKQDSELLTVLNEIPGEDNNMTIKDHDNSNDKIVPNVITQCANASIDEFNSNFEKCADQNKSSTYISTQNQDNNVTKIKVNDLIMGLKRKMQSLKKASQPVKRRICMSSEVDIPSLSADQLIESNKLVENLDSNQCLKYRLAIFAWKRWIQTKNNILKNMNAVELLKYDLLQLTKEELNHYLCMFIQEIEKPDGTKYAPDTIYYLCLTIQFYLLKNDREDNIFTDTSYEKFIDCMYEISKIYYSMFYNAEFIITRVEEEHLWDAKQLGAHSPQALLNTLIYFNTKYYYLSTVEEHMNISFSRIIKYWKDIPYEQETVSNCNTINPCLRYFPLMVTPISLNKCCVQRENIKNPNRCPIKLYELYLSKLPKSVKLENKSFYFMPEQNNCVAENQLWYSTTPMNSETLDKILHRVKMVKEVNIAFMN